LTPNFENLVSKLVPLLRRAIPSEALTSLLATFSALFKYIMIPSDNFNVIQEVWASFREALLKSSPEVRQATAEVWGVLVRKLKLPTRSELVTLLVSNLNGVEDFVPWVIVDACKVCFT
jgi:U3 small nucleolar RNA-associated protein 20